MLPQRIAKKIAVRRETQMVAGDCWIWTGQVDRKGYGSVGVGKCRNRSTHRVVYELIAGPIPKGLHLDHLCRVRACCNPAHLEPVTCKTNCERGERATKTHCPSGHPYSGENLRTHTDSRGYQRRLCRACQAANASKWRAERSADR